MNLAGSSGAPLDPCAAIQVKLTLQPGAETEVVFTLGEGEDIEQARRLVRKYRSSSAVESAFQEVAVKIRAAVPA